MFRHPAPLVLWWVWAAFALVNIGFLIADGLTIHSVRALAVLLAVTGVIYACTLHSRVEATGEGVTIYNPLRQHHAPWAAVTDVRLGQSVEFACTRQAPPERWVPGGSSSRAGKPTTIYSWALYSSSRARDRSEVYGKMFGRGQRGISARAPAEAAALAKQHPSQLMAAELGRRAAIAGGGPGPQAAAAGGGPGPQAAAAGGRPSPQTADAQAARVADAPTPNDIGIGGATTAGALRSSISWLPVAAIVIPAVFALIVFLVN